jgi:hypothetical protein
VTTTVKMPRQRGSEPGARQPWAVFELCHPLRNSWSTRDESKSILVLPAQSAHASGSILGEAA